MSRTAAVKELRSLFEKQSFTQVPPHPDFRPPDAAQQGAPPQDPNAMAAQQGGAMPPQGAPPQDPNAAQPQQAPPPSVDPSQLIPLLQDLAGKLQQVATTSDQRSTALEQELSKIRSEIDKEKAVREARRKTIDVVTGL
jgi:hypothetical protein